MSTEIRWIALLAILGFFASFMLWGRPRPEVTSPTTPAQTLSTPSTAAQTSPLVSSNVQTVDVSLIHGPTRLKFVPDSVDLGSVPVSESRKTEVRVENPTDKAITIRELRGSCGCLQMTAESTEIAPGGSTTLHLHFTSIAGNKKNLVYATFKTDEKGNPMVSVDVHATVKEEIVVEPNPVKFDVLKKNTARTQEIQVRSTDGKAFEIKSITGSHPEFSYKWEPLSGKNSSIYVVYVTLNSDKGGTVSDGAAIITDRAIGGTVTLNVSGTIEFDLACEPAVVSTTMDDAKMVAAFSVVAKRKTPGRLEILGVTEGSRSPMPLEFVVDRLGEDSVRLSVKFKTAFTGRPPFGRLQIKTNVEEADFIVPYNIRGGAKLPGPMLKKN